MSALERLELLTSQMHLEPAEDCSAVPLPSAGREAITVKTALMPGGKSIRLLKTLLSSYCENNCTYCPFRAQRDFRRAAFTPDDFARLFMSLYDRKFVEGIFLSSSILHGAIKSQDLLLDTAWILRHQYQFKGYLHLKIMPGAEKAQVEQAMRLADRLSVNLEAPHPQALSVLAPEKDLSADLINPLLWIEEIRQQLSPELNWQGRWPSSTTQFVVGAADESDRALLQTTENLFNKAGITRAYFSSFNPIEGTPLENMPPSPPLREHRLYQAFFLVRDFGYKYEELPYNQSGNLPLNQDPKMAWAKVNLTHKPVEINSASRKQLLRVPGIGPKRAEIILSIRKKQKIKSISSLIKAKLINSNSSPFILVDGKLPARQLSFF
jgi:predicted DNA-binding helix-hairpin-helix protein